MAEDEPEDSGGEETELERVDGVGPETAENLRAAGIETPADIADASTEELTAAEGVAESRADDLRATAAGMVGEVTVTVYDEPPEREPSDEPRYKRRRRSSPNPDDDPGKYVVVETSETTLVAGAPTHQDVLEDRVDSVDHFIPLRTDNPEGNDGGHYLVDDAWDELIDRTDEVHPPPEDGRDDRARRRAQRAGENDGSLDVTPAEASEVDWRQAIDKATGADETVSDGGPAELPAADGTVEVRATSATSVAVSVDTTDERRTIVVDFDRISRPNRDNYKEAFGDEIASDADGVVTTKVSKDERSELDGNVGFVGQLDPKAVDPSDFDESTGYGPDDGPFEVVIGPGSVTHGTRPVATASRLVDDLDQGDESDDYDIGGFREGHV